MQGQPAGRDGTPGLYRNVKVQQAELCDLVSDIGELKDVATEHPDIVKELQRETEKARAELGDALTGRKGAG